MFKTLYKRSHFFAAGIFAVLMITATAAAAVMHDRSLAAREAQVAPIVGRFVVTPTSSQFIATNEVTR